MRAALNLPAAYGFYDGPPPISNSGWRSPLSFRLTTQYDIGWVGRYQRSNLIRDNQTSTRTSLIGFGMALDRRRSGDTACPHGVYPTAINATTLVILRAPCCHESYPPDAPPASPAIRCRSVTTLACSQRSRQETRFGAKLSLANQPRVEGAPLQRSSSAGDQPSVPDIRRLAPTSKPPDVVSLADLARVSPAGTLLAEVNGKPTGALSRPANRATRRLRFDRPAGTVARDLVRECRGDLPSDPSWVIRGGLAFDPTARFAISRTAAPGFGSILAILGPWLSVEVGSAASMPLMRIFRCKSLDHEMSQTSDLLVGRTRTTSISYRCPRLSGSEQRDALRGPSLTSQNGMLSVLRHDNGDWSPRQLLTAAQVLGGARALPWSFVRPAQICTAPAGCAQALDHWQTQARAATDLPGGKERVECSREGSFRPFGSAVADRDDNIIAGVSWLRRARDQRGDSRARSARRTAGIASQQMIVRFQDRVGRAGGVDAGRPTSAARRSQAEFRLPVCAQQFLECLRRGGPDPPTAIKACFAREARSRWISGYPSLGGFQRRPEASGTNGGILITRPMARINCGSRPSADC